MAKTLKDLLGGSDKRQQVSLDVNPKTLQGTVKGYIGRTPAHQPITQPIQEQKGFKIAKALAGVNKQLAGYGDALVAQTNMQTRGLAADLSKLSPEELQTKIEELTEKGVATEAEVNKKLRKEYGMNPFAQAQARKILGESLGQGFAIEWSDVYLPKLKEEVGNNLANLTPDKVNEVINTRISEYITENNIDGGLMELGFRDSISEFESSIRQQTFTALTKVVKEKHIDMGATNLFRMLRLPNPDEENIKKWWNDNSSVLEREDMAQIVQKFSNLVTVDNYEVLQDNLDILKNLKDGNDILENTQPEIFALLEDTFFTHERQADEAEDFNVQQTVDTWFTETTTDNGVPFIDLIKNAGNSTFDMGEDGKIDLNSLVGGDPDAVREAEYKILDQAAEKFGTNSPEYRAIYDKVQRDARTAEIVIDNNFNNLTQGLGNQWQTSFSDKYVTLLTTPETQGGQSIADEMTKALKAVYPDAEGGTSHPAFDQFNLFNVIGDTSDTTLNRRYLDERNGKLGLDGLASEADEKYQEMITDIANIPKITDEERRTLAKKAQKLIEDELRTKMMDVITTRSRARTTDGYKPIFNTSPDSPPITIGNENNKESSSVTLIHLGGNDAYWTTNNTTNLNDELVALADIYETQETDENGLYWKRKDIPADNELLINKKSQEEVKTQVAAQQESTQATMISLRNQSNDNAGGDDAELQAGLESHALNLYPFHGIDIKRLYSILQSTNMMDDDGMSFDDNFLTDIISGTIPINGLFPSGTFDKKNIASGGKQASQTVRRGYDDEFIMFGTSTTAGRDIINGDILFIANKLNIPVGNIPEFVQNQYDLQLGLSRTGWTPKHYETDDFLFELDGEEAGDFRVDFNQEWDNTEFKKFMGSKQLQDMKNSLRAYYKGDE